MRFIVNNTGEFPLWNLRMHALVKNQHNHIIYDEEIPIASKVNKGETLDASCLINYSCDDTDLDITTEFKWDFFRSKEYHVQWKQDDAKILFSQDKMKGTLTVLCLAQKNLSWENNIRKIEGSAKVPSGIIKEGDVITDCYGTVYLGLVQNGQVVRSLGRWDFT